VAKISRGLAPRKKYGAYTVEKLKASGASAAIATGTIDLAGILLNGWYDRGPLARNAMVCFLAAARLAITR
jgi:hypothetical protein